MLSDALDWILGNALDWFFGNWLLWLLPVAFFGGDCDCECGQTCGGLCPSGAPESLQLTVPDATFDAEGTPDFTCDETECNVRCGVRLLALEPAATAPDLWVEVVVGPYPTGGCVWASDVFTACASYFDGGGGPVIIELEVRWIFMLDPGGRAWISLTPVDGDGLPTGIDNYVWDKFLPFGWACGDELELAYFSESPWGNGCTLDTGQVLTVELPP